MSDDEHLRRPARRDRLHLQDALRPKREAHLNLHRSAVRGNGGLVEREGTEKPRGRRGPLPRRLPELHHLQVSLGGGAAVSPAPQLDGRGSLRRQDAALGDDGRRLVLLGGGVVVPAPAAAAAPDAEGRGARSDRRGERRRAGCDEGRVFLLMLMWMLRLSSGREGGTSRVDIGRSSMGWYGTEGGVTGYSAGCGERVMRVR